MPCRYEPATAAEKNEEEMTAVMTFTCSICGESSHEICVYCTKDTCDNHMCQRCHRCSDCCVCESPIILEKQVEVAPAEPEAVEEAIAPEEALAETSV